MRDRVPSKSGLRPIIAGAAAFAAAMYYSKDLHADREAVVEQWTDADRRATLPSSIGIGFAVASPGRCIGLGRLQSRGGVGRA